MKTSWDEAKRKHDSVDIPDQLHTVVQESIQLGLKKQKARTGNRRMKQMAAGVLIAGSLFTTALNTSSSFAQAVRDIPIIGHLAQLVTFRSYSMDTPDIAGEVRVPELQKMRDPMVEALINVEIRNKMERHVEEAQMRAAEYREAYLATGGDPDAFRPLQIEVDYEIMSSTDQLLSFRVYAFESLASAYAENYYYTIDLAHNRVLTLADLLGDEYVSLVNEQVRMEIERMKESPDNTFFEGEMGFQSIGSDQPFYVNSAGNPVVVFNKYEIAPGYMGRLEFEIEKP